MRKLFLVAVTALSTLGVAQSPLTTLVGGANEGNVGGGLYFDLQVNATVTINQIDFRCGNTNTTAGTGTLDVWLGPTTYFGNVANPALWTYVGSVTTTVGPAMVASGAMTPPLALAAGNYGVALKSNAFNHGYTNGAGCSSTTIPGSCTNSSFSTRELTLKAGAAQNAFFSGGVFTPRVFNGALHYTLGGNPIQVAAWEAYGQGCYAYYRSFYQLFPNPAGLNLGTTGGVANAVTAIKLAHQGGAYHVTSVTSPIVTPTSAPVTLTSADSTFLATSVLPGGTLPFPIPHPLAGGVGIAPDLEISTDGYIVPAPATMPNDNVPAVLGFLGAAPRWCPHWKDMDPLVSGASMHVEQNPNTQALEVTWNLVADPGTTITSTFQVAFFPNGDVEYRYGTMSTNGGGGAPIIIGWTEGNGTLDPGNMEIATSMPFDTEASDNPPLGLGVSARPVLGTTVNLLTDTIPTGTTLGAILMGFTQHDPGLPLAAIGMPDCFAFASADASVSFGIAGANHTFPFPIPNTSALNGGVVYGQSVTISAGFNALGILTSNGVRMKLGSL